MPRNSRVFHIKQNVPYTRSYEYELVGQGEKETPLQKFQRLQCEITELAEEINQLKVVFYFLIRKFLVNMPALTQ